MPLVSSITFQDAVNAGLAVYDLFVSNWGDLDLANGTVRFPPNTAANVPDPFINNIIGMRIGPYSTVDAVLVVHGAAVASAEGGVEVDANNFDLLSVSQPLLYPIKGPIIFSAGSVAIPMLAGVPNLPNFVRTYSALGPIDGAAGNFGIGTQGNTFRNTMLHVQIFLTYPALFQAMERGSFMRAPLTDTIDVPSVTSTEQFLGIWPVWGRRSARVSYSTFGFTSQFTCRTTAAVCVDPDDGQFVEVPLSGSSSTVTPSADGYGGIVHQFSDLNVSFIIARAAKVGAGNMDLGVDIYAQD